VTGIASTGKRAPGRSASRHRAAGLHVRGHPRWPRRSHHAVDGLQRRRSLSAQADAGGVGEKWRGRPPQRL